MCTIQICVHCPEQESEILFDEVETAELAIEDLISRALLELFGTVFVEGVTICLSPKKREH